MKMISGPSGLSEWCEFCEDFVIWRFIDGNAKAFLRYGPIKADMRDLFV